VVEGVVIQFDAHRGLGEVEAEDGGRYPFHCTRIADGSRTIAVGAKVEFVIVPGLPGRWEAAEIRSRG
jgi:cold shock CspA family protein